MTVEMPALVRRRPPPTGWPSLLPLLGLWLLVGLLRTGATSGRLIGDEGPLLADAHSLLRGHYATPGTLDGVLYLWHGPGLPLLLAPMIWLGVPLDAMRLVCGPLLLFGAIVAFRRLLLLRLPPGRALAGAYAFGLYLPFGYLMGSLTKESLALLLIVTALTAITRALDGGGRLHVVLAGAALAALVAVRVEYGWALIVTTAGALAWALARRRSRAARRFLAVCAVGLVGCVPWLVYTHAVTGRTLYWGNSGGLSLYWMSSPSAAQLGEWHAVHTVFQDPRLAAYRPLFRRVDRLTPLQQDTALRRVAVRQVEAHPGKFLLNIGANAGRMLVAVPLGIDLAVPLVVLYAACNLLLLAALGWALRCIRRRGRASPEAPAIALLAGAGFLVHLLPSAEPRMFMPLVPLFIALAAQGWQAFDVRPGSRTRSRDVHAMTR